MNENNNEIEQLEEEPEEISKQKIEEEKYQGPKIESIPEKASKPKHTSKKKWIFIILSVNIMLGVLLGILLLNLEGNKKGSSKNSDNRIIRDSRSEAFQKNLLENLKDYLENNEEVEANLKENETLKLSSKRFVQAKEFDDCDGNINITKKADGSYYEIKYKCKDVQEKNILYRFYNSEGETDNAFILEDTIFLSSMNNVSYMKKGNLQALIKNDLVFSVLDINGKQLWTASYSSKDYQKSILNVNDVKKIGSKYYVFVQHSFSELEEESIKSEGYLLTYDVKGKLLKETKIDDSVNNLTYIGKWKDEYYYDAFYNSTLLVLKKDGTYDLRKEDNEKQENYWVSPYYYGIIEGNIFGIDTFDSSIIKSNLNREKTKGKPILWNEKYDDYYDFIVSDNYLFVSYSLEEDKDKEIKDWYIVRFNSDLNQSDPKFDYRKDVLKQFEKMYGKEFPNGYHEEEIFIDQNRVNVYVCDNETYDLCYLLTMNEELKLLNMAKVEGPELPTSYGYLLEKRTLQDNTVMAVFGNEPDGFILAIYK